MDYEGMSREELLEALRNLQEMPARAETEAQRLLHELQVHQVELEMQNRELREAQGALEESRNRYADLYDFAPVAYCTLSTEGLIEELNLTGATLFGVPREVALGRPFISLVGLEDSRPFFRHLARCAEERGAVVSEFRLRCAGRDVDVEAVSVPILGISGRARSFRTAFTDVTRRKQAEVERERAHRSEQLLTLQLRALDAAHGELSAALASDETSTFEHIVDLVTRRARALVEGDLASFEPADMLPEATDRQRASWVDGLHPGTATSELRLEISYGSRLIGTLRIARCAGRSAFSERERDTLRMYGERVSTALQTAALKAVEARENHRLTLLDLVSRELNSARDGESAKTAVARIADALLGRFADCALFFSREGTHYQLGYVGHCSGGLPDNARRAALATLDPPPLDVFGQGALLFQAGGDTGQSRALQVAETLAQLTDMTSLLVVPLIARDQNLGLLCLARGAERPAFAPVELGWASEIATRCALSLDNARLLEELRAALDWRETLLATISHDLKSPLSAISLSASALVPEAPIPERRTTRRQVDLIRRSADHMNHMLNDLLLESLLVAGTFQLETSRQSAAQLLSEASQLAEPLAQTRGLSLVQRAEAGLPAIVADRERVLRVFSNLIGNAAKFSPQGASIELSAAFTDAGVCFRVRDFGPGIPLEQQPQIFQRYWRGSKGPRGLGLGLYIAKCIVEAHRGRIWVDSAPGQGATFSFTIPSVS